MKQKYTITVADMELSIISDAAPDEVENIVGMLDRRIRDIKLKSPRCTKNEAAILCALAYCSERIAMQEAFKKIEKDAFRFAGENEKLKKTIESLQEELDNLRKDSAVMRSILDRATLTAVSPAPATDAPAAPVAPAAVAATPAVAPAAPAEEPVSAPVDTPAIPTAPVPASTAPSDEAVAPATEEIASPTPKKGAKPASSGKSRVGNMFDLLTFSDV
jgi:cell division protein ZapA (FtsZ GTPase activity inhibitor)